MKKSITGRMPYPGPDLKQIRKEDPLTDEFRRKLDEVRQVVGGRITHEIDWEELEARASTLYARTLYGSLPFGHVILEQADMLDGRVSQTVRDARGKEYERIVHSDEAYADQPETPAAPVRNPEKMWASDLTDIELLAQITEYNERIKRLHKAMADPDLLREDAHERARLRKEYPDDE